MEKQSNIRWRESDVDELRRIAKNYNAKLSRQRKKLIEDGKRFEAANLPPKASVRTLRKEIGTRKEFNKELSRMDSFIKTGARFELDANTKRSLDATVRDFNAKIDRLSKSPAFKGRKAALPEKLSADRLLKESTSKDALKRNIQDFKGFLKKGAETLVELPDTKFNIKLTKWQKESMEARLKEINKAREKERKVWEETEVKYGGKKAGYTQGQVRMDKGTHELDDMAMYTFSSEYADLREKFRIMIREGQEGYWNARAELARINYMEKMEQVIGNHPVGKKLLTHIKGLPLDDFKRTLKSEDDLFLLLYELEKHPDNYTQLLEEVWQQWRVDDMYDYMDEYVSKLGD